MGTLDPNSLTRSQYKRALLAINLIKEKLSRKLKEFVFADVRPQRFYITKGDASPTTISLKALFNSLVVDVHEGIDVEILMYLGHTPTLTC